MEKGVLFRFFRPQNLGEQKRPTSDNENRPNVRMTPIEYHKEPHNCQDNGEDHLSKPFCSWILPHPRPHLFPKVPI